MAIPYRGTTTAATYFVTAGTSFKQNLLQSDHMAELFCETLLHYRDAHKFQVHAFVVMPNHFHLLLTVPSICRTRTLATGRGDKKPPQFHVGFSLTPPAR